MAIPKFRSIWLVLFIFSLVACGDPLKAKIDNQVHFVETQLEKLAQRLDSGQIRNANLIKEYAAQLRSLKPEYSSIVNELARDAGTKGPLYTNLLDRFEMARGQPERFATQEERLLELENLYQAASPELYNDALSDPLNVLADLSQGVLPRVNAVSREASLQANQAEDFGAGSQLVGNPAYGQWSTQSNGMSFWEWYGMYALISNVTDSFSGRRVRYNDWARGRDYSYYHDYGRYRYSSPQTIRKQNTIEQKAKKSFSGGSFKSAYDKNRTGASRVSSASRLAKNSQSTFKSKYASGSSTSKSTQKSSRFGQSSFRSSGGSRSGGFGGK
ncbi:hypothetical protein [Catenovulum sediminis]|uniref:Lipoprotein n=1 Tax=Catenovulum sediminis TaxID=1740262 RepID=A0ABV1RN57_9ALTE|nr:hypothetical protein [Catenovulum sediminis]